MEKESVRVQVFHNDEVDSDSYSDSSDYEEQNRPPRSLLSRVLKPKKKWQDAAVQVYKRRHRDGSLYIHKVRLQSPYLRDTLKDLLSPYGVYFGDGISALSTTPHRGLYFIRHHVSEIAKMGPNRMVSLHCGLLNDVIQEIFRDKFAEIERLNREEKITFDLLWTLFPEGSTFGTQLADEAPRAYKVSKVVYDKTKADIKCETIMFSGYCFRRYLWNFKIVQFDGEVEWLRIPLLPYIDLEHKRDLRARLIERGRKALEFQSPRYMEYDPDACQEDAIASPWAAKKVGKIQIPKQKVVVDFFLARKRTKYTVPYASLPGYSKGPRMAAGLFRRPTSEEIKTNNRVVLESEENLLIMCPVVVGFCLSTKVSAYLEIDALKPVRRDETALERVVYDEMKKEALRVLVDSHMTDTSSITGRALVILLVGTAGTGKTTMSEALAAYLGVPLLTNWANVAETFEEARDWGACIFTNGQWGFGALPNQSTPFMSQLESFNGIVIASARNEPIIPSRISCRAQIHFRLPDHSPSSRRLVWEALNGQLPADVGRLSSEEIGKLVGWKLTGHGIKNVIDVSVTWCRAQKQPISLQVVQKLMPSCGPFVKEPPSNVLRWMAGKPSAKGSVGKHLAVPLREERSDTSETEDSDADSKDETDEKSQVSDTGSSEEDEP